MMWCKRAQMMTETLSVRLDTDTKKRLDTWQNAQSVRGPSFAAEAITAYVESEEWQLGELQAGIAELDAGQAVSHEKVSKWLTSQPEMGRPGRVLGVRELVVPDTPFIIPYRLRRARLELIAVFHEIGRASC